MITCEGYYTDENGEKRYFITKAYGIDSRRHVSEVLMRQFCCWLSADYRQVAWLLPDGRYLAQRQQVSRLHTGRNILASSPTTSSDILVAVGGVFHKILRHLAFLPGQPYPAEALHRTRLYFISHPEEKYRNPAVWSPYVMVGGNE
ncbi:hypothetical protein QUF80_01215 [Desulfococcaceae bacterium HSG8]|nr:hypothetical protein [Desulfococcaceae bacterium HSG8]